MPYEYLDKHPLVIKATGGSRAGLLSSLAQGLFAAAFPEPDLSAPTDEKAFDLKADDFPALVVALLDHAMADAEADKKAYEGIRFTLLTDKIAQGMFLGRPSDAKPKVHTAVPGFRAERNVQGLWECEVTFRA